MLRAVLVLPVDDERAEPVERADAPEPPVAVIVARSPRLAEVLPRPPRERLPAQPDVRPHVEQSAGTRPAAIRRAPRAQAEPTPHALTATVVTPLEPCGYVELDGCLKPARWEGPDDERPSVGEQVLVAAVAERVEMAASAAIAQVAG